MFDEFKKKAKAKAYSATGTIPPKEVVEEVDDDDDDMAYGKTFHTPNPFAEPEFVKGLQELDKFEAEKIHANAPRCVRSGVISMSPLTLKYSFISCL